MSQTVRLDEKELSAVTGGRYTGPTFLYTFQEGDDLYALARRYGTTLRVIQELNHLQDSEKPIPGRRLLFPHR